VGAGPPVCTGLGGAGLAGACPVGTGIGPGLVGAGLVGTGPVGAGLVGVGLASAGLVGAGLVGAGLVGAGPVGPGLVGTGVDPEFGAGAAWEAFGEARFSWSCWTLPFLSVPGVTLLDMATWQAFAAAAPSLADRIHKRFTSAESHILATLRRDGSPRVSGSEVNFREGSLYIGSMYDAVKARDLQRDGRFALHAHPGDPAAGGDAKLAGIATEVTDPALLAQVLGGGQQSAGEPTGSEQSAGEPAGSEQSAGEPAGGENSGEPAGGEEGSGEPGGGEQSGGEPGGGAQSSGEESGGEQSHLFHLDIREAVLTWVADNTLFAESWQEGRGLVRFARPDNGPVIRTELD
jgi:pyridoxamine 5'-phosphate oxidase-like protein